MSQSGGRTPAPYASSVVREVRALVSADDVVAAVAVHADRANDMLRRNGIPAYEAVDVLDRYAAELIAALERQPEIVGDLAGWWFGRCLSALAVEPFSQPADHGRVRSLLGKGETEQNIRAALAGLPRLQRLAVVLRDAYDLPLAAAAVALDRSALSTADLVAAGRLQLMSGYDDTPTPAAAGHVGRAPIDIAALTAVADGSADPQVTLAQRRHVSACDLCEEMLERMGRARRLALGLPVLALADADRERLIDRTRARADDALPTQDEVVAAAVADVEPRGVPMILVAGLLFIAAVLGVGAGAVSRHLQASASTGPVGSRPLPPVPVDQPVSPSGAPVTSSPPAAKRTLPPLIIRTSRTPPPSSSAAPARSRSAPPTSSSAAATAAMTITPTSGPSGTVIDVTGTGFLPGSTVSVTYGGMQGTTAVTDANGAFTASVTASAALPGSYDVTASDGIDSVSQAFDQTS